jgi:hypothetical protein
MAWNRDRELKKLKEVRAAIKQRYEAEKKAESKAISQMTKSAMKASNIKPKTMQTPTYTPTPNRVAQLSNLPGMASSFLKETKVPDKIKMSPNTLTPMERLGPQGLQKTASNFINRPMQVQQPQQPDAFTPSGLKQLASTAIKETDKKLSTAYKQSMGTDFKLKLTDTTGNKTPLTTREQLLNNVVMPYAKPKQMFVTKTNVNGLGRYSPEVKKINVIGENKDVYFWRDKDGSLYSVDKKIVEQKFDKSTQKSMYLDQWQRDTGANMSTAGKAFDVFSRAGASTITGDENIMTDAKYTGNPWIDTPAQIGGMIGGFGASPLEGTGMNLGKQLLAVEEGITKGPRALIAAGKKFASKSNTVKAKTFNKIVNKGATLADDAINAVGRLVGKGEKVIGKNKVVDKIYKTGKDIAKQSGRFAVGSPYYSARTSLATGESKEEAKKRMIRDAKYSAIMGGTLKAAGMAAKPIVKGVKKRLLPDFEYKSNAVTPDSPINNYGKLRRDYNKAGLKESNAVKNAEYLANKKLNLANKSQSKVKGSGFDEAAFNSKYRLDEDLSKLPKGDRVKEQVKIVTKLLDDSGERIASRLKTTDLKQIAKFYEKKFNLPKEIKVVKNLKDARRPARISQIVTDKNGNVLNDKVVLQVNGNMDTKTVIGAMRHEIQHYIESVNSKGAFKSKAANKILGDVKTPREYYKQFNKGHFKDYEWFEADYLKEAYKRDFAEAQIKAPKVTSNTTAKPIEPVKVEAPKQSYSKKQLSDLQTAKERYSENMTKAQQFDGEKRIRFIDKAKKQYSRERQYIMDGRQMTFNQKQPEVKLPVKKISDVKPEAIKSDLQRSIEKINKKFGDAGEINYIGKKVRVSGKDGKIIGNPPGKMKVRFSDGETRTFDYNTKVKSEPIIKPTEPIKQSEPIKTEVKQPEPPKPIEPTKTIPKETEGISKFSQTVKESAQTKDEFKQFIKEVPYEKQVNKEQIKKAFERDLDEVVGELKIKADKKNIKNFDAQDVVNAQVAIRKLYSQGKSNQASELLDDLTAKLTESGQTIQAASIWNRMTPEGTLIHYRRTLEKAKDIVRTDKVRAIEGQIKDIRSTIKNLEAQKLKTTDPAKLKNIEKELKLNLELYEATNSKLPAKYKKLNLTPEEESMIIETRERINQMDDVYAKELELARMHKKIRDKIPISIGRRIASYQTFSHLINPVTANRNIIGNTGFAVLENIADTIGTPVDKLISLKTGKRTTFIPNVKQQVIEGAKDAKVAFKEVMEGIDTRGILSQYDIQTNTFKNPFFGSLEKVLGVELKVPDRAFYKAAYSRSIRNQMKAAKLTEATDDMVQAAHLDGLYATFQDKNKISDMFVNAKKAMNKIGIKDFGLGDIILKYPKTPGNLISRGLDYSPAGVMRTLYKMGSNAAKGNNFNQQQFVQGLSRGVIGSSLLFAGSVLYGEKIIQGARDSSSKVNEYKDVIGEGQYTINVSSLKRYLMSGLDSNQAKPRKNDTIVTYDWLQPMAVNIGAGANIKKNIKERGRVNPMDLLGVLVSSLEASASTLAEQPILKGISDMFKYGATEGLSSTLKGIPAGFIPTAVNQVRKYTDNTIRKTASTENDYGITETVNRMRNKIPVLNKKLPESVTTTGEVKRYYPPTNKVVDFINAFINPAFIKKYNKTKESDVLLQIYDNTGESNQLPRQAAKKYTFTNYSGKKVQYDLTPKEQSELQKFIGKKAMERLPAVINNSYFDTLEDEEKIKRVSKLYDTIGKEAKDWMYQKVKNKLK